jgi:Zn-dependent peptidase ImmA (M78 family)
LLYGIYKDTRNAAWRCLIDYNVSELPVKPSLIARAAGIKVIKNSDVHELAPHESGASVLDGKQWYIIYDDENTRQRCRFTVAHELGHIFLGHELRKGYHARTFDTTRPTIEQQADAFAARLLAPACVLWALNVRTMTEIAELCDISNTAAQIRAERMKILYSRNKFLTSPLEKAVYDNFKEYIQKQTAK